MLDSHVPARVTPLALRLSDHNFRVARNVNSLVEGAQLALQRRDVDLLHGRVPPAARASRAATAADWPRTMNTGSIRIDPYAMWLADRQTGTSRFAHWASSGTIAR